jgi:hypothetical protein
MNQIRDSLKALGDPWTAYTPVWSAQGGTQPTIGNGTATGGYILTGKRLEFWAQLTMGSTSTYGSVNPYLISPPPVGALVSRYWLAQLFIVRNSAYYSGTALYSGTDAAFQLWVPGTTAGGVMRAVAQTVPITFANLDRIMIQGVAEVA